MPPLPEQDRQHLRHAARLALRGRGGAEPNPLVGCVIVDEAGLVVGEGYHRNCGEDHAEIHALRRAGALAADATVYVTLEPCNHTGRTGPCSEALIAAGVRRVVVGRRDPHPEAGGGVERLQAAGVDVEIIDDDEQVRAVSDPFAHRVVTGLPWVIAKWAQTIDGRIATRSGQSQWISNDASRRLVHRERGRVDAILTGIGTVLADDPMLTARDVRVRRVARRVVVDPKLQVPLDSALVRSAGDTPLTVACRAPLLEAGDPRVDALRSAGVELVGLEAGDESMPLRPLLLDLSARHDIATIMVESGSGLLGELFRKHLVQAAWVFIAPLLLGDEQAKPALRGADIDHLVDATRMRLMHQRRRGGDIILRYRVL